MRYFNEAMDKSCEKESIKNVDVLISRNNDGSLHFASAEQKKNTLHRTVHAAEREKTTRNGATEGQEKQHHINKETAVEFTSLLPLPKQHFLMKNLFLCVAIMNICWMNSIR